MTFTPTACQNLRYSKSFLLLLLFLLLFNSFSIALLHKFLRTTRKTAFNVDNIPDLNLKQWTTYEYEYEGEVNFGLAIPNVAQSGVRMTCKVKVTNGSESSFFLQVRVTTEENAIFTINTLNVIRQVKTSSTRHWRNLS